MPRLRTIPTYAGLASALMLGACAATMPRTAQTGLEGQWMDERGVAVSTFSNGQFVTIATDTGNRLSEGNYRFRDRQTVEISMRSLIRQTEVNVNCARVAATRLNCTNAQGQNFVLTRRS